MHRSRPTRRGDHLATGADGDGPGLAGVALRMFPRSRPRGDRTHRIAGLSARSTGTCSAIIRCEVPLELAATRLTPSSGASERAAVEVVDVVVDLGLLPECKTEFGDDVL